MQPETDPRETRKEWVRATKGGKMRARETEKAKVTGKQKNVRGSTKNKITTMKGLGACSLTYAAFGSQIGWGSSGGYH